MGYNDWFEKHASKHQKIIQKLQKKNYSQQQIIEYFDFENMVESEIDFCPLYLKNQKCHEMEKLNCYLCACPNFRFNDEGIEKVDSKTQYSLCSIDSKDGRQGVYGEKIHQDCSSCSVPHHLSYVEKNFSDDWKTIMHKCHL